MSRVLRSLELRYVDGATWVVDAPFAAESDTLGTIVVAPGERTDFNSVPRGLWNIFPPDEYGEAAVLHDHLYRVGLNHGRPITRLQADRVHREFLNWRGAAKWRVAAMYMGLRLFGWMAWNRYRKDDGHHG